MNFTHDFVTDYITEYAFANDVPVPSFDPEQVIASIHDQFEITNGFTISNDEYEYVHGYGLALEVVASRLCGI